MAHWNRTPEILPLRVNPLFERPLNVTAVLKWYAGSWLPWSFNIILVGISFAALALSAPTLEAAQTLGPWVFAIWARNLILTVLIAHSLHLIFHRHQLQGLDKKYDPRPFPRKGGMFTFGAQLTDNMIWTLGSGVTIWSLFEVLIWWSMANGYAPLASFDATPVWFIAIFFLIPIWESFYFYWIHRLLHTPLFYRFHALHHRNTDIGPWSGLSMHPVEHLFYFGTALIHFLVPTHPVHLIFHLAFYGLYAIITHTGFEGFWAGGRKRVHLGNFHHQMHHRYFEVNYGTLEMPWDVFFGTFHDGSENGQAMMKKRLKKSK